MSFLRFLKSSSFLGVEGGFAFVVLARWAFRVYPPLRNHRRAVRNVGLGWWLASVGSRALAQWGHVPAAQAVYAVAMVVFVFLALGAIPILFLELAGWLWARVRPRLEAREGAGLEARGDAGVGATPPSARASASSSHLGGLDPVEDATTEAPPPKETLLDTAFGLVPGTEPTGHGLSRRQVLEGVAGLGALTVTAGTLAWGALRGRHDYRIEEVPVRIAGLPRALEGYTIAQISDVHVGLFVGEREIGEGFARLHATRPDLVVVTGDLVDYDASYAERAAAYFARLRARDGVYAVLGNHDYYTGPREVAAALARTDVKLLVNRGARIRPQDGGGFALLGVDDNWGRSNGGPGPDLVEASAIAPPDVPRILLAHQPVYFDEAAGKVALQLSGHTHGGQLNPGHGILDAVLKYREGRFEKAGSTLWVNRGFGVAGPPSRVNAPPEITKIILVSA